MVSISLSTIKITRLSVRHQDELSVRPHLRLEVTDEIYALEQELLPIIRAIPIYIRFSLRKFQRFHQEDQWKWPSHIPRHWSASHHLRLPVDRRLRIWHILRLHPPFPIRSRLIRTQPIIHWHVLRTGCNVSISMSRIRFRMQIHHQIPLLRSRFRSETRGQVVVLGSLSPILSPHDLSMILLSVQG